MRLNLRSVYTQSFIFWVSFFLVLTLFILPAYAGNTGHPKHEFCLQASQRQHERLSLAGFGLSLTEAIKKNQFENWLDNQNKIKEKYYIACLSDFNNIKEECAKKFNLLYQEKNLDPDNYPQIRDKYVEDCHKEKEIAAECKNRYSIIARKKRTMCMNREGGTDSTCRKEYPLYDYELCLKRKRR